MKTILKVEGMSCSHCVNAVKNAVGELQGVSNVDVSLEEKIVTVEYNESTVTIKNISDAIIEEGFEVV